MSGELERIQQLTGRDLSMSASENVLLEMIRHIAGELIALRQQVLRLEARQHGGDSTHAAAIDKLMKLRARIERLESSLATTKQKRVVVKVGKNGAERTGKLLGWFQGGDHDGFDAVGLIEFDDDRTYDTICAQWITNTESEAGNGN